MENLAIGATFVYILVFILFALIIYWLDYWRPDYSGQRRRTHRREAFKPMLRNLMHHLRGGHNKKAA